MTTTVEKSIQVDVPISTVYNQWTQFAEFPRFMGGVEEVTQLGDNRMHWVAQIAGVRREWDAVVLEQVPDQKVAWAATTGATNAGAVTFTPVGAGSTTVTLVLEYEPEGVVEKIGDRLSIVERQAQSDLEKFKSFIEDAGYATGTWRGTVDAGALAGAPGVEDAAASRGDDGKAGISTTAVIAGVAAAAAGIAAVSALSGPSGDETPETVEPDVTRVTGVPGTTQAADVREVTDVREVDLRGEEVVTITPGTTASATAPTTTLPPLATGTAGTDVSEVTDAVTASDGRERP